MRNPRRTRQIHLAAFFADEGLVKQIIYTSAATRPFSEDDLKQLLEAARARNSANGLTGMLLFHTGSFLQVLEGDDLLVDRVFSSIASDPNHTSINVLEDHPIQSRDFKDWSMGFVDAGGSGSEPAGLLNYVQLQPLLTLDDSTARKYLCFFHLGLRRSSAAGILKNV